MKPILFGQETELAVSGSDNRGPLAPELIYSLLEQSPRRELPSLPSVAGSQWYLANGGKFYCDVGGHPEYATPEVATPRQLAICDQAGDRLVERARRSVEREHRGVRINVIKNNTGVIHPELVAWASHESYTCWQPLKRLAGQLIPHLVSRVFYAGAGGLWANPRGMGFELSQRARHLVHLAEAERLLVGGDFPD